MSAGKEPFIPQDGYTIYDHVKKNYKDHSQWPTVFKEWWEDNSTSANEKVTQLQRFPLISAPKTKYLGLIYDLDHLIKNDYDDFAAMIQAVLAEELLKYASTSPDDIKYTKAITDLVTYLVGIQRKQKGISVKNKYLTLDRNLGDAIALSYLYIHNKEANQHDFNVFLANTSGSSSTLLKVLGVALVIAGMVTFALSVGYAVGFTVAGINTAMQTLAASTVIEASLGMSLCVVGIFSLYKGRQTCIASYMQTISDLNPGNADPLKSPKK